MAMEFRKTSFLIIPFRVVDLRLKTLIEDVEKTNDLRTLLNQRHVI